MDSLAEVREGGRVAHLAVADLAEVVASVRNLSRSQHDQVQAEVVASVRNLSRSQHDQALAEAVASVRSRSQHDQVQAEAVASVRSRSQHDQALAEAVASDPIRGVQTPGAVDRIRAAADPVRFVRIVRHSGGDRRRIGPRTTFGRTIGTSFDGTI